MVMVIIKGIWQAFRGMALLLVLAVIFSGVLALTCLARLFGGSGSSQIAGKLQLGA